MDVKLYTKTLVAIAGVIIPFLNQTGIPLPDFLTVDWVEGLLLMLTPAAVYWFANKSKAEAAKPQPSTDTQSPVLIGILAAVLSMLVLSGCAGTRAAYEKAEGPGDVAKVMVAHYTSLVDQANAAAEAGVLTGSALSHAQEIVQAGRGPVAELGAAKEAWEALKTAETEAELDAAILEAAKAVSRLIDALDSFGITSRAIDAAEQYVEPLLAAA